MGIFYIYYCILEKDEYTGLVQDLKSCFFIYRLCGGGVLNSSPFPQNWYNNFFMAITPKKRFTVLQRDWFQCKYCGQKPPFVQLEVDHIIPKAEWWWDEIDNLVSSCSVCNMWKGKDRLSVNNPNLWKAKITDTRDKIRKEFTRQWNDRMLWSIDRKTFILLLTHIKHYTKDPLQIFMNYGEEFDCMQKNEAMNANSTEKRFVLFESKFKEWWEYCDAHLKFVFDCFFDFNWYIWELFSIIEEVCEDTWTRGKNKLEEEYSRKLNYCLTKSLLNEEWYEFLLRKYTLHNHLLNQ